MFKKNKSKRDIYGGMGQHIVLKYSGILILVCHSIKGWGGKQVATAECY